MKPSKYPKVDPIDVDLPWRAWPTRIITKCPRLRAVCLRDGNQALPDPMDPQKKLEYFQLLCKIGFKEIEVAFPSASADDFNFVRKLIEENLIPDDVTISVLVQCRADLIAKTMESLQGVKRAMVHIYIATSELHIDYVFNTSREATIANAVMAAKQIKLAAEQMPESEINLEFSPEESTDTGLDLVLDICQAVFSAWGRATTARPLHFNLPATVERQPPNQVADMFECFIKRFNHRDIIVSCHAHNDQGMGLASAEMAVLAGADCVEGGLFVMGERTGNIDIITFALNLYARGIDIPLDLSNLPEIVETFERLTGLSVPPRHPYAGALVFTAFSGSHQDAIEKGMKRIEEIQRRFHGFKLPYILIDPADIGRQYDDVVRLTSQSGKGGLAFVLKRNFGIILPKRFQPIFREVFKRRVDQCGGEVSPEQLLDWLKAEFVNPVGPYKLIGYWPRPDEDNSDIVHGEIKLTINNGDVLHFQADGNGPIDAFVKALAKLDINGFTVGKEYDESAMGEGGSGAQAIAFMPLECGDQTFWGVGIHTNTTQAAVHAIIAALNRRASIAQ